MQEGLPSNIPIAIVDEDKTSTSRALIRQLDLLEGVEVIEVYENFNQAQTAMQKGNIYGVYLIPRHFTKKTVSGKQPVLSFYTNNSYMMAGSIAMRDMKTASVLAAASAVLQTGRAKGYNDQQITASIQPIVIESHPIGNPGLNYSVYLNNLILPGIFALMIMCVTIYSISIEIKEKTEKEWFSTENFSITFSLVGKLLPQTILFFIVGLLLYVILYILMQFPFHGNIGCMILVLFLFILASQAMGVFMTGCFPTLRLGLSFACLFGMIAFSISGFSYPVNAMYPPIQAISNIFPLRHYFLIYVDQALNGRTFFYSWPQYLSLASFLVLPAFTLRNLKWSLKYASYQA
jgi:ABC-2 type transport system permease protein